MTDTQHAAAREALRVPNCPMPLLFSQPPQPPAASYTSRPTQVWSQERTHFTGQ